jgi:hypothetical protein
MRQHAPSRPPMSRRRRARLSAVCSTRISCEASAKPRRQMPRPHGQLPQPGSPFRPNASPQVQRLPAPQIARPTGFVTRTWPPRWGAGWGPVQAPHPASPGLGVPLIRASPTDKSMGYRYDMWIGVSGQLAGALVPPAPPRHGETPRSPGRAERITGRRWAVLGATRLGAPRGQSRGPVRRACGWLRRPCPVRVTARGSAAWSGIQVAYDPASFAQHRLLPRRTAEAVASMLKWTLCAFTSGTSTRSACSPGQRRKQYASHR